MLDPVFELDVDAVEDPVVEPLADIELVTELLPDVEPVDDALLVPVRL